MFWWKNKNSQTEGVSLACKLGSCRNCSWGRALLNSITIITGTKELLTSRPITCISTTLKTIKFNKNCPKDSIFKKSAILKNAYHHGRKKLDFCQNFSKIIIFRNPLNRSFFQKSGQFCEKIFSLGENGRMKKLTVHESYPDWNKTIFKLSNLQSSAFLWKDILLLISGT